MKKLFSFAALCAVLYATPACANFYWLSIIDKLSFVIDFNIMALPIYLLPIFLALAIQGLLLRYALKDVSYIKAFLMACVGNIPSTLLGSQQLLISKKPLINHLISYYGTFVDNSIAALGQSPIYWVGLSITTLLLALTNTLLMLITLALIFRCPVKKLIMPILLGNIVAYILIFAFGLILRC
jgi:hypothetical protein